MINRINIIILGIFLMLSVTVFHDFFKKIPSRGNWEKDYEDEKWAQISMIVVRVIIFVFSLLAVINAVFFYK